MKQSATVISFIFLFLSIADIPAQDIPLYNLGMMSLNAKDTSSAETYFKQSITQDKDAASFYELANIQVKKSTYESRNLALDNYKQAILRDPENMEYRLVLAKLKTEMSASFALNELDELIPDNIKDAKWLVTIADIYEGLFEKYRYLHLNANLLAEPDQLYYFDPKNLSDYAEKFLTKAEIFYLKALSHNIYNDKAVIGYARLNAFNGAYDKAIYYLEILYQKKPDIKDLNLYLGIYYYKIKNYPESLKHFDEALSLMNEEENKVYTYSTVMECLDKNTQKKLLNLSMNEQKKYIKKYWETKDPLLLSTENERLIEHYYRVAYSNYFLNVPRLNIPGWQTDRGKVFISFGDPVSMFKMGFGENRGEVRDTWYYNDRVLHFNSMMYDNYKLDWEDKFTKWRIPPILRVETSADIYDKQKYERFDVSELKSPLRYSNPLAINVFKSFMDPSENEIFFSYMIPMPFSMAKDEHEYGLFLLNRDGEFILKKTGTVVKKYIDKIADEKRPNYQNINTIKANIKPGDIRYSFETKTLLKQNVSTLQREFSIVKFKKDSLDLSGIVIASKIAEGKEILGSIKRKDIYIIPKIGSQFSPGEDIYIYYEVYNLSKSNNDLTDFEQTLVVRESDPVEVGIPLLKMFRTITEIIADTKNRVSLTSSFKTNEANTQIYQQLDFSGYKPGKYDLYIVVTDKKTGQRTERKCSFKITEKME